MFPETSAAKQSATGSGRALKIDQALGIRPGTLKYRIRAIGCRKWPRGVGIRKFRERSGEFRFARVESSPCISVEMINDRAGTKELPDARHIFARDAEDHVEKFI